MINEHDIRRREILRQARKGIGVKASSNSVERVSTVESYGAINDTRRGADGQTLRIFIINQTPINAPGYYFGGRISQLIEERS